MAIQYHNCSCNATSSSDFLKKPINRTAGTNSTGVFNNAPSKVCPWQRMKRLCICMKIKGIKPKRVCNLCYYCGKGCSPLCGNLSVQQYMHRKHLQTKLPSSISDCISLYSTHYYNGDFKTSVCCSTVSDKKGQSTLDMFSLNFEKADKDFGKVVDDLIYTLWKTLQLSLVDGKEFTDKKLSEEIKDVNGYKINTSPILAGVTSERIEKKLDSENVNSTCSTVSCTCRGKVSKFKGAGCYSNRSVSFFYMDSGQYWRIAENLGVQNRKKNKAALVIIDIKNEAQYVHEESKQITNHSAVKFVMKFMDGNLTRRLRSAPVPSDSCVRHRVQRSPCIEEVVTRTFEKIVLDDSKDVMLMHYAPWCVYCKSVAPVYLALSNYFKSNPHLVFARIDADSNDLPWGYTVQKYPSFIFYAAGRKDRSVRFPDTAKRTLRNFVTFILRHATQGKEFTEGNGKKLFQKINDLQDKLTEASIRQRILESQIKESVRAKQAAIHLKIQAQKLTKKLREDKQKERSSRIAIELQNKELSRKNEITQRQLITVTKNNDIYLKQVSVLKTDLYYVKLLIDSKIKELEKTMTDRNKLYITLTEALKENTALNELKSKLETQIEILKNNFHEVRTKLLISEKENDVIRSQSIELQNQKKKWMETMEIKQKEMEDLKEKLALKEQTIEELLQKLVIKEEENKKAKEIASTYISKLRSRQEDFVRLSKKLETMEIKTKKN